MISSRPLRVLGDYFGDDELRLPRPLRWFVLLLLVIALVGDLFTVISLDGAPDGSVELGDYFSSVWAFLLGVVVIHSPRWAHIMFVPMFVVMAGHPTGYEQIFFTLVAFAVTAYSAPIRVTLIVVAAAVVWQVAWLVAIRPEGLAGLWTTLPTTMVATAPGLAFRYLSRRRGTVTSEVIEEAVQGERRAMARELHDVVAHELTIIAMQARVAERSSDAGTREEALRAVGDHARGAIVELSRLLHTLRRDDSVAEIVDTAHELGPGAGASLSVSIDNALQEMRDTGMKASATVEGPLEEVPSGLRSTIRALILEGTTNAIKHGGPQQTCHLKVSLSSGVVQVVLRNEIAPQLKLPRSGYGLAGLNERVTMLRGSFTAGREGNQWVMRATIPVS